MQPRLYTEFTEWWPLLSSPDDYAEEADTYYRLLAGACREPPSTLLELGSGGGNNAHYLAHRFEQVALTDLSPAMLAVSRGINPGCEHVVGDMRDLRLGRLFDCVFVHDAIVYMTTEDDLRRTLKTAFVHCRPGGVALFVPDYVRETFVSTTGHGGRDGPERALRYLQWEWDPDPTDSRYTIDFVYLMRAADGSARVEYDRHLCGLFGRDAWCAWLAETGFEVEVVPIEHSEIEPGACEAFVCRKP